MPKINKEALEKARKAKQRIVKDNKIVKK